MLVLIEYAFINLLVLVKHSHCKGFS